MKKLTIDSELLEKAHMVSHLPSKEETINKALEEFIQRRKQARIIELFGTIDYDQDIDKR